MNLISSNSVEIKELNLRQILIRGDHTPALLQLVKSQFKISLPKNNLEIEENKNVICSKSSFDQWNIIFLQDTKIEIDTVIDKINENEI